MGNSMSRRRWMQATTALALPTAATAWALESYPTRPVRIVVPLPAGGTADAGTRILAEQMHGLTQQSFVVDNKPGGIFLIAMQAMAQAPADGYTLISLNSGMVAAQVTLRRFDMLRQLVPVSLTGSAAGVIAASPLAPFKTIKEMIDWARAHPGRLNYGSAGPGSLEHLTVTNFARKYGFSATHVPFKGGPDAMTALAQNEIHVFTGAVPIVYQFMQKNLARPLAMMVDQRSPLMPEVGTLKEHGIDLPVLQFWGGWAAPAGTPRPVVEALQRLMATALGSAALRSRYSGLGMTAASSSGEAFARLISEDLEWMSAVVRDADLKFQ